MAVPDQPVNAGVSREPYYGETQQIEEQQAAAPLAKEKPVAATPAAAPVEAIQAAAPVVGTEPIRETISRPQMAAVSIPQAPEQVAVMAEPDEKIIGAALLTMPGASDITRRMGLALRGYDTGDVQPFVEQGPIFPLFRRMDMREIAGEEEPMTPQEEVEAEIGA